MKKLLARFAVTALIAAVPYTAPVMMQPALAAESSTVTTVTDPISDLMCRGGGKCCENSNDPNKDPFCQDFPDPDPPVCPPSCGESATEP